MQRTPKQGRKLKLSGKNGVNNRKKSEVSSTPKVGENVDSPPWLSDSPCHSSAPSPIPFLCTQDGSSGEHDVVWNYYSPSSDKGSPTHHTPIRKRKKKFQYNDFSPVTRIPMKKKLIRPSLRKKEFLKGLKEELIALNKNVQGLMCSAPTNNTVTSPDADTSFSAPVGHIVMTPTNDDCLFDGIIKPPQELVRDECEYNVNTSSLPLKNNAFDKVSKCDNEGALESDDSMNEFLLKASQMIEEEHLLKMNTNVCDNNTLRNNRLSLTYKNKQVTKLGSPKISNDSFENLIGNMNDSEIEFLTQAPPADKVVKKKLGIKSPKASSHSSNSPRLASAKKNTFNFMKNSIGKVTNISKVNNCWNEETGDSILNNISNMSNLMNNSLLNESRSKFGRHKSMPESPTPPQTKKLKSNGASSSSTFSRHSTMPTVADIQDMEGLSQPMKCTPDEIKKKHQAAREKLMARKQEPGSKKSSSLNSLSSNPELDNLHSPPKLAFQTNNFTTYKTASSVAENVKKNGRNLENNTNYLNNNNNKASTVSKNIKSVPLVNESKLQEEIERKRKEALQKLQMKKALGLLRK